MIALCYDNEGKRLYKGTSNSKGCLFSEHTIKGYYVQKIQVPGKPVDIVISSNLYYQGASYLFAELLVNGKSLLNFQDRQALYLVNHHSLDTFQVPAGNWDELFDIIIRHHNNSYFTSEDDVENFFIELDNIISKESIAVFRNKTAKEPNKWDGTFLVLLHSVDIISNIIKCKDKSLMRDNIFFEKKLLETCKYYLQRFSDCYPNWVLKDDDSRIKRFSTELFAVCKYVELNGNPFDFVDNMINHKK